MVWNERINTTISHCGGDKVEKSRWLSVADTEVRARAVHLSYLSEAVSASNLHAKIYTRHICLLLAAINGCHVVC